MTVLPEQVVDRTQNGKFPLKKDGILQGGNLSQDEDGTVKMFDFEGGPCFNLGAKIEYLKWKWTITKITPEKTKKENLSSVVLEVK